MILNRRHCLAVLAASTVLGLPQRAAAQDFAAIDQRLLLAHTAARLSRGACFAALEIEPRRHLDMLTDASHVFGRGPMPKQEMADTWAGLAPHVAEAVAAAHLPDLRLSVIVAGADGLRDAAMDLAREAAQGEVATQLLIAGELAVLVQSMAALAAQSTLGLPPQGPDLTQTIADFDERLAMLQAVASTPGLSQSLAALEPLWQSYRKAMDGVALIGLASQFELTAIAAQADPLDLAAGEVAASIAT